MMKSHLLCVLVLCIWLGQICAGNDEAINEKKQLIRDEIYAVGEQFVDDFLTIREQYENNLFIREMFQQTLSLLSRGYSKEKNSKIVVSQVKEHSSKSNRSSSEDKLVVDYLKITQSTFSKQFPPERYNGIINVLFTSLFNCATTEEIQSVLNYLYGIDIEATKTSFMDSHNLPKITSEDDCPKRERWSSRTIDMLRSFVNIKPQVIQNFLAIREQFPCSAYIVQFVRDFVDIVHNLGGDERKINACMIKERVGHLLGYPMSIDTKMSHLEGQKSILSTRLPDDTIRGIFNIQKAAIVDMPIEEIESALEYLYEDVPRTECPTTKNSTVQVE